MADRDYRKPVTPPKGVAGQIVEPTVFEEENTGVGDIGSEINTRAKNASTASRAAFASINQLRKDFSNEIGRTHHNHQALHQKVEKIEGKVDEMSAVVSGVRETVGHVSGQVELLVNTMQHRQHADHVRFVAAVEVEKADKISEIEVKKAERLATVEDTAAMKKFRRTKILKLLGIIGTLATGIGGLVAAAATRCG